MNSERQSTAQIELAELEERAWALDIQDDSGGRSIAIGSRPVVVGTAKSADVVVFDPTVSAQHLELSILGNGITVRDRGSKNGTFIGAAKVSEAWAASGTMIMIGRSSIICRATAMDEDDIAQAPLDGVAGGSSAMRRIAAQVRRLARYAAPVLIMGESGTGKELIARALHTEGARADKPFVAINVTALPRELVESELFGHERGAFTGAHQRRLGAFAEAREGSLFLDEIGDLPIEAQPKLLRALDGYDLRRVGGSGVSNGVEARVIAATNVALEHHVAEGRFRRDLFHRLEVFVINVPPLRERRGDIGAIARDVLFRMQRDHGTRTLTSAALARLSAHDWPGNVRELRNTLIRAADLAGDKTVLDVIDIERGLPRTRRVRETVSLSRSIAEGLMKQHRGNLSAAARAANCPRTTFRKLLVASK